MHAELEAWVNSAAINGVVQHSADWKLRKQITIGGSSLATIQGVNPYSTLPKLMSERCGITHFNGDIKVQWGNMFEDVIKRCVEHELKCKVLGEDLYIAGSEPEISYSPDGLGVCEINGKQECVLFEFKCPFSRIPNNKIPAHYLPQVKMGLDVLEITTKGVFVEGVFRRCVWDDLDWCSSFDKTLQPKSSGKIRAFGLIGMYVDNANVVPADYYECFGEHGDASNGYMCQDLGSAPVDLFKQIMSLRDTDNIHTWFGGISWLGEVFNAHEETRKFSNFCEKHNKIVVGVLPWKLFRLDYHFVEKEPGYMMPWMEKIKSFVATVQTIRSAESNDVKLKLYEDYAKSQIGGFDDEW